MTFYEALDQIGANRKLLFSRFANQEALALHFYRAFLNDPSFKNFVNANALCNTSDALSSLHQLQGLAGNLSMENLMLLCQLGVKGLRLDPPDMNSELYDKICSEYERICSLIRQID